MSGERADASDAGPPSVTFASGGLSWTRVSTPRLLSRIAKVIYGLGALNVVGILLESYGSFGVFLSLLSMLAWPLFIVSYILSLTQNAFPGSLEVSATDLVITTRTARTIPRSEIVGALVVEREVFGSYIATVEIELANGDLLTARLGNPRGAVSVVKALGFGIGGRRVHAALAKPTRRLLHPLFGFVAYLFGILAMYVGSELVPRSWSQSNFAIAYALYPLLALAAYAGLKRLTRAPEITVGDDGVMVKNHLRRVFVPRREIAAVTAATGAPLVIERHGGDRVVVGGEVLDNARRSAIARVIEERAGPSTAATDRFTHYDRGGRALAAWRDHLGRSMQEASYRENAATVDEAASVLRSTQATPEQRVGAALALRVAGEPKERIRVAADAAVDDRVREALEAVAEADDDIVLEKALRRMV